MTDCQQSPPALHCPHCDYNLTGLPENRCPECGNEFDPIKLRKFGKLYAFPISMTAIAFRLLIAPAGVILVTAFFYRVNWTPFALSHRVLFLVAVGLLNLLIVPVAMNCVNMAPRVAVIMSMRFRRMKNWRRKAVLQLTALLLIAVQAGLIYAAIRASSLMFGK